MKNTSIPSLTSGKNKVFIAYYRVSTQRQGQSGLGLDAQKAAVQDYVRSENGELMKEFTEVESGRKTNRVQLAEAIRLSKRTGSTLVIGKLCRLARNLHFISGLLESNVDFVACDMPSANRMTIGIISCVNEEVARRISIQTKESLKIAKARGVKLGVYGKTLARKNKEEAVRQARELNSVIEEIRDSGITGIQKIADEMNRRKIPTARGGKWHRTSVMRLLQRVENVDSSVVTMPS